MTAPALSTVLSTFRDDVRAMHAYHVQDAAGFIKLDAMENPFTLPAPLRQALGERLARVELNRYPGTRVADLQAALRSHLGLASDAPVVLGNGSDELISLLYVACARPGATVLAPLPGFVMYGMSAQLQGLGFTGVPLTADFELDGPAMLAAIEARRPAITWIAYPNNPTANLWDDGVIGQIIDRVGELGCGFVVIDEAYQPFASRSWLSRLSSDQPHVLLMRTLSKFGLAGIRLGYLIGHPEVVRQVDKVRPPYNVSVLNAEAALFALEHADEFGRQAALIRTERERLMAALAAMPGAHAHPSEANMILVRVADAAATFAGLRERGILIKNVSALHPLLDQCIRLTVGQPAENDALIAALRPLLAEPLPSGRL